MPKQKKNRFVVGITGNFACGKSTVAAMFKTKNCLLIDADCLGHELLVRGTLVYRKLLKLFGPQIINPNKQIDRGKLGKIVFADNAALVKFNSIVHPVLIIRIKELIKNSAQRIIILDAALIIEAGLRTAVDKLIVVTARKKQQILRARAGLGLTREQIIQRLKSQISQKEKLELADFTIDNSGLISETRKQVLSIRRKLWKS